MLRLDHLKFSMDLAQRIPEETFIEIFFTFILTLKRLALPPAPDDIVALDTPVPPCLEPSARLDGWNPLPLNCPRCGVSLHARRDDGVATLYVCAQHGVFWIDASGFLRDHGRLLRFYVPDPLYRLDKR